MKKLLAISLFFLSLGVASILCTNLLIHNGFEYFKNQNYCFIEGKDHVECYNDNNITILEQYYKVNKNRTGFVNCGPVNDCQTDSCNKVSLKKYYECQLVENDIYLVGNEYPLSIIFFMFIFLVVIMLIFTFTSFCFGIGQLLFCFIGFLE